MTGLPRLGVGKECECGRPECARCRELAAIEALIRREFAQSRQHAPVPTPEILWWRAQTRAREEATRTVARPIVFTQALAIAALLGLLVSVIGRLTLPVFSWSDSTGLQSAVPVLQVVAVVAACWLVLAPVALYFAFSREKQ